MVFSEGKKRRMVSTEKKNAAENKKWGLSEKTMGKKKMPR